MNEKEQKIVEIITGLAELFNQTISKTVVRLYYDALVEYPLEQIRQAATYIIRTHKYATMPKPAEFIEFMHPPDEVEHRAAEALRELEHQQILTGTYQSVKFDDTVLQSVIQYYGGWPAISDHVRKMDEKEYMFFRKEFTRLYKLYARRPNEQEVLPGRHEIENSTSGYLTEKKGPKLIGDTVRKMIEKYKPDNSG